MSSTFAQSWGPGLPREVGAAQNSNADAVAAASVKHRTLRECEFRLYSDAHVNKHSVDGEKKGPHKNDEHGLLA